MADPVAKISALPTEADKADRVKLWSFARPHYLSFHLSWAPPSLCPRPG